MRSLIDCPACACLIDGREAACPFCGCVVRSNSTPMWLALGLVLGVGVADVSCGGKGDNGDGETSIASGVTYAGPDTNYSSSGDTDTDTGDTVSGTTIASGVTYAGPDETWTASEPTSTGSSGTDGTGSSGTDGTGSSGTTAGSTSSSGTADASTYAGPDESTSTGP